MKRVLIVEDEILARVGLHQLIDWEREGFLLLEDAKDGKEAMEHIRNDKPDIMLLDLNIPGINGLQILKYIREQEERPLTVVISCNEEFDMVKEAMKLGAYDYLRKLNLSSGELLTVMRKCANELDKKESSEINGEKIQVCKKELRYEELIGQEGETAFEELSHFKCLICVICQPAGNEKNYILSGTIKKWMTDERCGYIHITKNGQYEYFLLEKGNDPDFVTGLYQMLCRNSKEKIYIGICRININSISDLNRGITLAEQISLPAYYDEDERIRIFQNKIAVHDHSPREIQKILPNLKEQIELFRKEEAKSGIKHLFCVVRSEKYTHINVLRRNFMDLLGIYSMVAGKLNGAIEEIEVRGSSCHYQDLMSMNSINEIEKWFFDFEEAFYAHFFMEYKCSQSELLKSTMAYIDDHITERVSLKEAAKEIGVSGAYLSTVFKREMGQNLIEFINTRKVQMAKEMLRQGKLVYEVSDLLGFENVTYFSKVFKKYEGVAPDSYRRSGMEKKSVMFQ